LARVEEVLEERLATFEEGARHLEVLGRFVGDLLDPVARQMENRRLGVSHDDRRVRRDEELRAAPPHVLVDEREERELSLRRERGLGLVEDVEPLAAAAIVREREEALAVRLLVERLAAVSAADAQVLDLGRDVEEALGAEEVSVPFARAPRDGE